MDAPAELGMSLDEIIKNRSKASKPQKPTAATATAAGAGRGRGGRHNNGRGGAAGQSAGRGSQRTPFVQGKGNYQPTAHQPGNTRSTTQTTQTQHRGGYGSTASTMRIQTSFSNQHDAQRRQVVFASDGERATRPAFPGQRAAQQGPRVSVHNRIQHTAQPQRQPQRQPQQQQQQQLQQLRQQRQQQQQLYEQQQFQRYQQFQQRRHLLQQQQEQQRPAARTPAPSYGAQSPSRYDDDDDEDDEHYEMEPRRQAAAAEPEDPMQCFKAMSCLLDEDTGDVTVKYRNTTIAVVGGSSGEMVLMPEGGERSKAIYECLQNMLLPIGFQISSSADKISSGQWHIIGASSMAKLKDGLLVPAKGATTATRAAVIHAFLQNRLGGSSAARPQAHQAATRASTLAAAELGLLQPKGQTASQAQLQGQQQAQQQQQLLQQQMQQFQQQQQQQQVMGSLAGQAAGTGNGGFVPMPMASSGIEQHFQQQLLQQQHMMAMISEGMMGHGKELPTRSTLRYAPY